MTRIPTLTVAFVVLGSLMAAGETKLPDEPDKLVSLRGSWIEAKERDLRPLKENYLEALIKLRDQLTKDGKLERAVLVRDEIEVLTGVAEKRTRASETSAPQLAMLRATFEHEVERIGQNDDKKYIDALRSLLRSYSDDGNLEAALAVKRELAAVDSREEGQAEATFIGWTYVKPSNRKGLEGLEVLTFLEDGKVERKDGANAGWEPLGDRRITVWKGDRKSNPMTWNFDESFEQADVYSPYHRTTVKATREGEDE